jgi:hypothetical protein
MIHYRLLDLSILLFHDSVKVFNGVKTERFAERKKDADLIQHPTWARQSQGLKNPRRLKNRPPPIPSVFKKTDRIR